MVSNKGVNNENLIHIANGVFRRAYKGNRFPSFNSVMDFSLVVLCGGYVYKNTFDSRWIFFFKQGYCLGIPPRSAEPLISIRKKVKPRTTSSSSIVIKSAINGNRFLDPHYQTFPAREAGLSGDTQEGSTSTQRRQWCRPQSQAPHSISRPRIRTLAVSISLYWPLAVAFPKECSSQQSQPKVGFLTLCGWCLI